MHTDLAQTMPSYNCGRLSAGNAGRRKNKSGNFKKAGNLHHDGTVLRHHEFVIRTFINYNILCHLLTFFNETGVQPGFEQDTKGI